MDQRIYNRKAVSLRAVVSSVRFGSIRGSILDLGETGLYVRAETSIVPIGAEVTVSVQPGGTNSGNCLRARGRIAHQSLQGFGIEFIELDAVGRDRLARMLSDMPLAPSRAAPVLRTFSLP